MATAPQRPDPDEPRPQPQPVAGNFPRVEREVGTGRPFSWVWIWIPVVIAAFWFVGWGWGPYGGWWWGHGSESATQSANSTVPTPPNGNAQPANSALASGTATAGNPQAGHGNGALAAGPAAPAAQITGTGVAALDAVNKRTYIGQPFQISNVPVEKKASSRAYWIGASNTGTAGPMLLVLPSSASINAKVGDRITAAGTVEKAPPAAQAQHQWSIGGDDVQQLEREGAYVQATNVQSGQP
jgi:hypothetical protein